MLHLFTTEPVANPPPPSHFAAIAKVPHFRMTRIALSVFGMMNCTIELSRPLCLQTGGSTGLFNPLVASHPRNWARNTSTRWPVLRRAIIIIALFSSCFVYSSSICIAVILPHLYFISAAICTLRIIEVSGTLASSRPFRFRLARTLHSIYTYT